MKNSQLTQEISGKTQLTLYRPALTLILPFEPKMTLKSELSDSLKMAAEKLELELRDKYPAEVSALVISKLRSIISDLNFSTHKKSVAIYVSPVYDKVIYLDIPVTTKICLDGSFQIRDLLESRVKLQEYLLLYLSSSEMRMYLGNEEKLVKIISDTPEPTTLQLNRQRPKALHEIRQMGVHDFRREKFLRHADVSLGIMLGAYNLPLIVAGKQPILDSFRMLSNHLGSVVEWIPLREDADHKEQVIQAILPVVSRWEMFHRKNLINKLEAAKGRHKLVFGIGNVWKEARHHMGGLLMVAMDFEKAIRGGADKGIVYMPAKPYNKHSPIKDVVDDVIKMVLENGGDVELIDGEMLKHYQHIVLV